MAGRDITPLMADDLQEAVVRPVLIVRFDIVTDPLTAWTGPGTFGPTGTNDAALDNQVFLSMAPIVGVSNITEDQGIGSATTITVSGHDLDEDLLQQIVRNRNKWRGQNAYLWLGLLMPDEHSVRANPMRIKTGVMTQMTVSRAKNEAVVIIEVDKDLGRAKSAALRWIDHQRIFSTDTWSAFIFDLMNQPEGFTNTSLGGFARVPTRPGTDKEK